MIEVEVLASNGTWQSRLLKAPVSIGRSDTAIVFPAQWRVAKRHADLLLRQGTVWVVDHGSWVGTCVNGKRILAETPLNETDEIRVGRNRLRARVYVESLDRAQISRGSTSQQAASHRDDNSRRPPVAEERALNECPKICPSSKINRHSTLDQADRHLIFDQVRPHDRASGVHDASESFAYASTALSEAHPSEVTESAPVLEIPDASASRAVSEVFELSDIQRKLHRMLLDALDLRREDVAAMSDEHLRARAYSLLTDMIESNPQLCPIGLKEPVIQSVLDEALGLGPLEPLLDDDGITEIMVNRFDEIYVERAGRLHRHPASFTSQASVLAVIDRIVAPIGRRIDESSPMVDARLSDGSRVNAVVAPVALKGATLTIRKFGRRRLRLDELVGSGALSEHMAAFLSLCVTHKKNIVVSGGTGSGKTTLLNVLSGLIGAHERVITIEDAAELQLPHEHVVSLEARPANMEGRGRIDIRDLVRNALRMRPDRIVVGECRGAEAFDMLAAMNTGHEGSLTTLHANTPRDALARLETMILMAGMDLPLAAVREHIASGIDLIVQQARLGDGRRVVTDIAEVCGIDSGGIQLQPLLVRSRVNGRFSGVGVLPGFVDTWREQGIALEAKWFDSGLEQHDGDK